MSSFAGVLGWLVAYRYVIILPLVVLEGPIVMLVSGFLVRLGSFEFFLTYLLLVFGDFIGDVFWYYIGYYSARKIVQRFDRFFNISTANIERFEKLFLTHDTKILLISKLTMGFGFASATLAAAGAAHVPFKKFALINIGGGFVWTGFLVAIGYFFGNVYESTSENFRIGLAVGAGAIAVTGIYLAGRYARTRLNRELAIEAARTSPPPLS